jgi:uncharacterized protein YfbU (UPF0304 family)
MHLSRKERLSFIYQLRILEALYPDAAKDYGQTRVALEKGFASEYCGALFSLPDEMSIEACEEVVDILDMYRAIALAVARLPDGAAAARHRLARFSGFDAVFERQHNAYMRHIMGQGRFAEMADAAHRTARRPMLPLYRALLARWNTLVHRFQLEPEQLEFLLEAGDESCPTAELTNILLCARSATDANSPRAATPQAAISAIQSTAQPDLRTG